MLTRPFEGETEIVVATTWESIDAVKRFAGESYETAVIEPIVHDLLQRVDDHVTHFTLAAAASGRE